MRPGPSPEACVVFGTTVTFSATPLTPAAAVVTTTVVPLPAEASDVGVPDFTGMSAREVLREAARLGLTARLRGAGVVVEQNPPPGAPLEPGATTTVVLTRRPPTRVPPAAGDPR